MIGKNIRRLREQKGLTLSDLADQAGVSKSYLSGMERDLKQNPSIHIIEKVCGVLDVTLETILETKSMYGNAQQLESEWLELIEELRELSVDKEQLLEYKALMRYIKWKAEKNTDKVNS
ncbi:helix-turn-helix domain-containing protein [Ectobacillus antri]|uniref:helix-turn-helix domain-containing protein n=1 Tax=Ectobacillus antri TaxID=2486280 RepID=UPI000F596D23|nr:helix-turn-helix transcriptional regulator [Ectobacillus antri]